MPEPEQYGAAKVAPEGIPNVRLNTQAPAEAFGGGQARAQGAEAAAGIATELGDMQATQEYNANQVIQQEADNHANKALNDAVYGVMDDQGHVVKRGLKQYTGDKVLQLGKDDLNGGLAKQLDDIQSQLPNPRVQANFERTKREILDRFDNESRPWVVKQLDEHDKAVTGQAINTYSMDGILNANQAFAPGSIRLTDPDGNPIGQPLNPVDLAAAKMVQVIVDAGARRGLDTSDPEIQNQLHGALGQFHQGVISQLLQAKQPGLAEKYFKEHEVEMLAKHAEGIEAGIAKVKEHVYSQNIADHALASSDSLADALAKVAKSGGDEDMQHKAAQLVRQGFAERREIEDQGQQQAIAEAEKQRGGSNARLEQFMDPTIQLSPKNQAAVKYLNAPTNPPKSDRSALRAFTKIQTGSGWFGSGTNGLKTMDRSTLLTKYVSKVSATTGKYMMAAWKESQAGTVLGPGAGKQLNQHADNLDQIEKTAPDSSVNTEEAYYQHPAVVAAAQQNRLLTTEEQKAAVKDTAIKAYQAGPPAPPPAKDGPVKWMDLSLDYRKTMESLPGLAGKVLSAEQKDYLAQAYHATRQGDTKAAKHFYQQARDWQGQSSGTSRGF